MPKTMVSHVTETPKATNIYLTEEVAIELAHRLIEGARKGKSGVRIIIRNKDRQPDITAYDYNVANMRSRR